ncbi:MAG: hypothetical protein LBP59_20185 [Planctomycetaceae bacterium]|nr:hypothetical protein [Planctomycetaceae bacterium]
MLSLAGQIFIVTKNRQQDRRCLACTRLYSTANERGFALNRLFVCLSAKCRRDARDLLVCESL